MSLEETIAEIRRQGGLVYVPHPFDRLHSVPDYEHLLEVVEDDRHPRGLQPAGRRSRRSTRRPCASPASTGSWPARARTATWRRGSAASRSGCATSTGPQEFLESMREADIVRKHKNLVYVQALKFLQTSGGRGRRPRLPRRDGSSQAAGRGARRARVDARGKGPGRAPKKRQGAVPSPTTDDEIREKYLERAIRELNDLGRELSACADCPRGNVMPVQGSGHPQADIFMLKHSATPAEIEEGVAFYGRAGNALMKSFKRLAIDPIVVFGTLCVKCPLTDPDPRVRGVRRPGRRGDRDRAAADRRGDGRGGPRRPQRPRAAAGRARSTPIEGEIQSLTPTIDALYVPDIDDSLDERGRQAAASGARSGRSATGTTSCRRTRGSGGRRRDRCQGLEARSGPDDRSSTRRRPASWVRNMRGPWRTSKSEPSSSFPTAARTAVRR